MMLINHIGALDERTPKLVHRRLAEHERRFKMRSRRQTRTGRRGDKLFQLGG